MLYQIKQSKEVLDQQITEQENIHSRFNEGDICLISNSGNIDYILNLNSKLNPNSISNKYL